MWTIEKLKVFPTLDGKSDVVSEVFWKLEISQSGETEVMRGIHQVELGQTFVPYSQLTQQDVLAWVWQSVNKDLTEAACFARLAEHVNPPTIDQPLPWGQQ